MSSFIELVAAQQQIGQRIEIIIRNYKKDPVTRKTTTSYFQERLRKLDEEWANFESNDNQIRLLEQPPLEHDYFQKDYYTAIRNLVQQYKEVFETSILNLGATKTHMGRSTDSHGQTTAPVEATREDMSHCSNDQDRAALTKETTAPAAELVKLIRRQAAMISSVERLLTDDFTQEDAIAATRLWQDIQSIHYKICETCDEPILQGYNMERFIQIEKEVRIASKRFTTIAVPNNHYEHNHGQSASSTVPIPKITMPRFDGNYMKWKEFHDLFSSLIIQQSIPTVQKMWYLKTHLEGEAANLIKHFATTGENFDAAWSVVTTRYDNRRLLVSKLIQEMVDTPTKTASDNYKSFQKILTFTPHHGTHYCSIYCLNDWTKPHGCTTSNLYHNQEKCQQ